MEHYYTQKPQSSHNIKNITFLINGIKLEFYTDAGVFSKTKVDYGSEILIQSLPELSGRVLDLGCGYGAIGISLAKLNTKAQIAMADINERAVELAVRNIERNQIKNAYAFVSNGFKNIHDQFNAIVCNPPIRAGKKVIYTLFEQSKDFLVPGGCLFIVIQKRQGAKSALEKLISIFGNCEVINKKGGYWILKSIKT